MKSITLEQQIELVADAFQRGALVDMLPEKIGDSWQVIATNENGNAIASADFPSEKQAWGFVDLLVLSTFNP